MINLYNRETGSLISEISEAQLQYLIDQMEEESTTDQDYYINTDLVDSFEADGADPELVKILRNALAGQPEMEIRWSRN